MLKFLFLFGLYFLGLIIGYGNGLYLNDLYIVIGFFSLFAFGYYLPVRVKFKYVYLNSSWFRHVSYLLLIGCVVGLLLRSLEFAPYVLANGYAYLRGDLFTGSLIYSVTSTILLKLSLVNFLLLSVINFEKTKFVAALSFLIIIFNDLSVGGRGETMVATIILFATVILRSSNPIKIASYLIIFISGFIILVDLVRSGKNIVEIDEYYRTFEILTMLYLVGPIFSLNSVDALIETKAFGGQFLFGAPSRLFGVELVRPVVDFGAGYTNSYSGFAYLVAELTFLPLVIGFILGLLLRPNNFVYLSIGLKFALVILCVLLPRDLATNLLFFWVLCFFSIFKFKSS